MLPEMLPGLLPTGGVSPFGAAVDISISLVPNASVLVGLFIEPANQPQPYGGQMRQLIVESGNGVRSIATFMDIDGDLVDPTVVSFSYRIDSSAPVNFLYGVGQRIVRDSMGVYHIDIDTTGFAVQRPAAFTAQWASPPGEDSIAALNFAVARINPPPIEPVFT
jgi:hypothetical protein